MKNRRLFVSIFAVSLAVTLLISPVKVFNNPVVETIQVQAEEEPITDTQRGVALLMTIMLAQGLRFVGDWNTVVQPGLVKLWDDFSTATGNAVTLPMLVAGSSLALGYIRTSNTVNNAIANFTAWYKNTFSQPITGETSIPVADGPGSFTVFNQCASAFSLNGNYWRFSTSANTRSVTIQTAETGNANVSFYFFSTEPFSVSYNYMTGANSACSGYNETANSFIVNGVIYYRWRWRYINGWVGNMQFFTSHYVGDDASWDNAFSYCYGSNAVIGDISMTGESLDLKDGYQLESDQAKLYDIAGLEALVASLALTLENIDDLVRDIPLIFDTPWAEDFPDVPAYVNTPDDTIPWVDVPDSVIPADTPEYVPTIPSERDQYKVLGLDQVFPFSIPFDLYYLSQILVSHPETPEFQYAVVNPVNGQLLTLDVDLHDFDGVAAIFRTCETVLFIAFLIWITRSLIRS